MGKEKYEGEWIGKGKRKAMGQEIEKGKWKEEIKEWGKE